MENLQVAYLWPTPLVRAHLKWTNEECDELVALSERVQTQHRLPQSPYFYVRNRYNLLETDRRPLLLRMVKGAKAALTSLLSPTLRHRGQEAPPPQFAYTLWTMMQRDGDFVLSHHHIGSHWTCVFYIKCDPPRASAHPHSGWLVLSDPRARNRDDSLNGASFYQFIEPEVGLMVLFPGYVQHEVPTYQSDGMRVAYVLNINVNVAEAHESTVTDQDLGLDQ